MVFSSSISTVGKSFDMNETLADLIMQNDEYSVYYDDFNGKVLSAEFLKKAE